MATPKTRRIQAEGEQSMNYIRELNAFYDWLESNPCPSDAIALWHALVAICNKAGWPEEFTVANPTLQAKAGLSRTKLDRWRGFLKSKGLIDYKKSERVNEAGKYRIIPFASYVQNETQNDTQNGKQNDTQDEAQNEHINKTKLNETNIYLSSSSAHSAHEENAKGDGVPSTEPNEAEISSFRQIEAKYIQRRARGFDLMPNDILVIEQLLQDGIPVDTILRGIDKAFDEYKPRFKNDRIKSMTYCEPIIRELHYLNENRKEANERAKTRKSAGHGRDSQESGGSESDSKGYFERFDGLIQSL